MSLLQRPAQRRRPRHAGAVHVGATTQQEFHHRQLPAPRGESQRRRAVFLIDRINGGAVVDEQACLADLPFRGHVVQQGEAVPVHVVRVHPVIEQERGRALVFEVVIWRPLRDRRHTRAEPNEEFEHLVIAIVRGAGEDSFTPVRLVKDSGFGCDQPFGVREAAFLDGASDLVADAARVDASMRAQQLPERGLVARHVHRRSARFDHAVGIRAVPQQQLGNLAVIEIDGVPERLAARRALFRR